MFAKMDLEESNICKKQNDRKGKVVSSNTRY